MPRRTIIHLDMDAFFASVEQQCNPRLRRKPVAVVGRGHRTVITTSSYEARACGVKTGMNTREALRCCPGIIFVEADNARYTHTCAEFAALCREFTPLVEIFSVDEVFLDVSGSLKLFNSARAIASGIKKRLRQQTGLTCSAGIAPNKLLAKLASTMGKPDGLVAIGPADTPRFLENLPVSRLCGIGKKLEQKLAAMGITTCGQLGRTPPALLRQRFGIIGEALDHMGRGEDDSPVIPLERAPEPCSVGHSMTLSRNIGRRDLLAVHLLRLSEMVGRRTRRGGFSGKTVTLTLRYADFSTFSRQRSVSAPICASRDIYLVAKSILDAIRLAQSVRLVGVSLSRLVQPPRQIPLFPEQRRQQELTRAMDTINNRFGDFTVTWANLGFLDEYTGVISPAWRPRGTRKIDF